jgi:dynein heavy chain
LLKEKKNQLQNQASKLRGGLSTLNATRESVAKMQIVCQDKAVVVAQAKKECEEILVEIVSEKRVVDEQELKVKKPFSLFLSLDSKLGFAIAH